MVSEQLAVRWPPSEGSVRQHQGSKWEEVECRRDAKTVRELCLQRMRALGLKQIRRERKKKRGRRDAWGGLCARAEEKIKKEKERKEGKGGRA